MPSTPHLPGPQPDPEEIRRTIRALYEPGDVVEMRVPKTRQGTISGYFDNPDALAKALVDANGQYVGIYLTLNPCKPALLARSTNHIRPRAATTTSDADILVRHRLLVDCDPVRPADISSTDQEHDAAIAKAREIRSVLAEEGWPAPILADSGNGAHLVYAIDLPNDEASEQLVKRVLQALARRFDDDIVKIDQTVFNAARISKAYGTITRKGDDNLDRPHRVSRIMDQPSISEAVTRELMEELADRFAPKEPPRRQQQQRSRAQRFDIDAFVARFLKVHKTEAHEGGRKIVLEECPFDETHKAPDSAVFERADGSLAFKCFHNSCANYGWKDVRAKYDPPVSRREQSEPPPRDEDVPPGPAHKPWPTIEPFEFEAGRAVFEYEDPPVTPIIDDLVYPGFMLFAGRPKSGKSWLTLQMALAVARGRPLAGWLMARQGRVLYLALEEPRKRTTARMRKLAREGDSIEALDNIRFVYRARPMMSGGLEELEAALASWPADLVVIDTLRAFARTTGKATDIVQRDYVQNDAIRRIADKQSTAIVGVDHTRKASGDLIDAIIGTTGSTAGCDAVWVLSRTLDGGSVLEGRGREHDELSYALRFHNLERSFGWEIYGSGDDARMSAERAEIIELLRHEGPLKPRGIAQLLKRNANTTRVLLSKMLADQQIVKQEKGYVLAP